MNNKAVTKTWPLLALYGLLAIHNVAHAQSATATATGTQTTAKTEEKTSERFPVVPGVSVGRVKLGDTQAVVRQKMGRPTTSGRHSNGVMQDSWLGPEVAAHSADHRFFRVLYKNGRVTQIEFNSPQFVTSRGISSQSMLQQFRARYPRSRRRSYLLSYEGGGGGHIEHYFDHRRSGLCFEFGTQDDYDARVRPTSLRVHRRNTPVIVSPGAKPTQADDEKPISSVR
ncbi:MAG: hypothetical protein JWN98_2392 [Abditibacteriota bacterium]|nr:hypothetical protein [Abditibacteriota bacterium]